MCCKELITHVTAVKGEPACRALFLALTLFAHTGCAQSDISTSLESTSLETAGIPAGEFISGSDAAEREYAYTLAEAAYGHSQLITRYPTLMKRPGVATA